MIIAENSLLNKENLKEIILEILKTGTVPKGSNIACNINNGNYCLEPIGNENINLFCELRKGYTEIKYSELQ